MRCSYARDTMAGGSRTMKPLKVRNEGLWREMDIRSRNVTRKLERANYKSNRAMLSARTAAESDAARVVTVPLRNVGPQVRALLGAAAVLLTGNR